MLRFHSIPQLRQEASPMATRSRALRLHLLLLLIVVVSALPLALSAPKKPAARKEDIPFIRCQVCERLAREIHRQVHVKDSQNSAKKVPEIEIIEIAEKVCNLKKQEADWILRIDIVEKGDALELVEQESEGQCNSECKTIERACQEVMGYYDTDIAEYIYNKWPSVDSLVNYLCKDLSGSCSQKPPPVPKDRAPGEEFVPKSTKDAEMDRIMKSMEGLPGAPGMKMYSREDLMKTNTFDGEDDDDEDEDDDEDGKFPSQLGKILREKDSATGDFKQRMLQGIKQTGNTISHHLNKASNRMKKWWGQKGVGSKKAKPGKVEL